MRRQLLENLMINGKKGSEQDQMKKNTLTVGPKLYRKDNQSDKKCQGLCKMGKHDC